MKVSPVVALLISSTYARHHHHHNTELIASASDESSMEALNAMSTNKLVTELRSTLDIALAAESRDDTAAAVAKTAAIKNIQKALTARILKRLDDGQPLVEVARKMKAIEGMQPQINDMERRLGIMQSVEPVLENAIKTLQKVVDVRGMGKSLLQLQESEASDLMIEDVTDLPRDQDPVAVAKAQAIARVAAENERQVAKAEKAAAAAEEAALKNEVTSVKTTALKKKEEEDSKKEEAKDLAAKEKAAEAEEKLHKALLDEYTADMKKEKAKAAKKTVPAVPLDRDGKPLKCKPAGAEEEKKDDDKEEKKDDDKKDDKKDKKDDKKDDKKEEKKEEKK